MTVQSKAIDGARSTGADRSCLTTRAARRAAARGMMEAQRFPDDFDAMIVGAPVYNMVRMNVSQVALQMDMLKNSDADRAAGHSEALCRGRGRRLRRSRRREGRHRRRAAGLQVRSGRARVHERRRRRLSHPAPGGQRAERLCSRDGERARRCTRDARPVSKRAGGSRLRALRSTRCLPTWCATSVRQDPNFDPMTFDFEADLARALKNGGFIEASDPDIAKFKARGGKLLLYHGWADPGPAPENTINYYDAVLERRLAGSRTTGCGCSSCRALATAAAASGPIRPTSSARSNAGAKPARRRRDHATRPARGGAGADVAAVVSASAGGALSGQGSTDDEKNFACVAP